MKKNLNIAYLNGAEGMIRKGGASSGGSGSDSGDSGNGSSDNHLIYYKFDDRFAYVNDLMNIIPFLGYLRSDGPNYKMYHSPSMANVSHNSMSQNAYFDAFIFTPIKSYISGQGWLEYSSYEELREAYPDLPAATRITAEEYWADYDAE